MSDMQNVETTPEEKKYVLQHTGEELDAAIKLVLENYIKDLTMGSINYSEDDEVSANIVTTENTNIKQLNLVLPNSILLSKSYALGTENTVRDGDATDNAKFYYTQSKLIEESVRKIMESISSFTTKAEDAASSANSSLSSIQEFERTLTQKISEALEVVNSTNSDAKRAEDAAAKAEETLNKILDAGGTGTSEYEIATMEEVLDYLNIKQSEITSQQ